MLPKALATKMEDRIRVQWTLKKLDKDTDGMYTLEYETPEGAKTVRAKTVAMTAPAYVVADMLTAKAPAAAAALKAFDYPPVAAVTVAYPKSAIKDERKAADGSVPGFGQLHPRTQGIVTLGTIYSSTLFPGRAPEEMQLLLCYFGGATNRKVVDMTEDEVVKQVTMTTNI